MNTPMATEAAIRKVTVKQNAQQSFVNSIALRNNIRNSTNLKGHFENDNKLRISIRKDFMSVDLNDSVDIM